MTTFHQGYPNIALNNSPVARPSAGAGAPGRSASQLGIVQIASGAGTSDYYRMARIPTNAIVEKVALALELDGATATTWTVNVGLYWSDAPAGNDNTNQNYGGPTNGDTAIDAQFFAHQVAANAFTTFNDITFQNQSGAGSAVTFYVPTASFQPLWMAISAGGFQGFDSTLTWLPKGPWDSNWGGEGAMSTTTSPLYQIGADPGGMLDIVVNPTSVSISGAMTMALRVDYIVS